MAARLEAEKFTGTNDFGLWRMKIRAMLTQQGLASALETKQIDPKEKGVLDEKAMLKQAEIEAKAHSKIVLCLADKVLREVAKETTAAGILSRLEDLYLTKSLANQLYMKRRLYSYKFLESKGVLEQLEEFNKSIDDLENIDVLQDVILYGRDKAITFVEVQTAVRAKELHKEGMGVEAGSSVAESLNVKKHKFKKPFKKDHDALKFAQNIQKKNLSESTRSVILGNNQVCQVEGIGSVKLKMNDGCVRTLTDVGYIPQVKRNLISLGLLERKGCVFSSAKGRMVVRKWEKEVMEAERRGSLYYLLAEVQVPMAQVNSVTSNVRLWHMRLGHPAEGSMRELVRKGTVQTQLDKQPFQCEECVLGKSKKLSFQRGSIYLLNH
ncbi:uncharacterized protein LOC121752741 [Salvia splendens]|uniref:uncharacterized protein LOC121752741 n=1 Tax=Salvia splendens TaxID=180675 RepID=UPI001C25D221|nr:uncharacterized protein LOC121752741 [Salvia splendens]